MARLTMRSRIFSQLAVLLVLVAPCIGVAQDWIDEGGITSRPYENQIREGRQIVATEFFTLEYSVQTSLAESGGRGGPHMVCRNRCNGNVHDRHEDCDNSCDNTCTEEHTVTRDGDYQPDRDAMRAATRAANALAAEGGGTHSPTDWSSRVSQSLANLRREARREITWQMPHADPCSGRDWWVGSKSFTFTVRGTMTKVGFSMSRGVRTPINEVVGTHEQIVARAWIAQEEPLSKHTWERCACRTVAPIDWESLMDLMDGLDNPTRTRTRTQQELHRSTAVGNTGILMTAIDGEVVDPGESKITVTPNDLNGCVVEVENGTGRDVNVTIPIGTTFGSADPSVQDMTSMVSSTGLLLSGETIQLYVSLSPVPTQTTKGFRVRWACLQMSRKEPTPDNKFSINPPQNDVVQRLGSITNESRFRGPHDQARIWIYTDKAQIDEINDRLLPGVTPGRYSTLLWEVATVGGVDLTSGDYQRCLEPKLLNGIPSNDLATAWLVGALTETKARDLARYVESNAQDLAGLINVSSEFAPSHLSTMVLAMANSDNPQVERAAVRFLQLVPEEYRTALAKQGALRGLSKQLASNDRRLAEEAVNVLIDYPAEFSNDLLGASWEQLPSEGLKEVVRKHLGIEEIEGG